MPAWRTSNTLTSDICVEVLQEALAKYGTPEFFNTDQGAHFTSDDFTGVLQSPKIKFSMNGSGRWMDNVFVERLWLWRSVNFENVYLHAYGSIAEANRELGIYFQFYNRTWPHRGLERLTQNAGYFGTQTLKAAA